MLEARQLAFGGGEMPDHLVDFTVSAGNILMITGPSGIGKTSLLNIISGFMMPHSGALLWQGNDILAQAPWQRPLSFLFQQDNFFDHLSCRKNLALGIRPSGRLTADEQELIETTLTRLSIYGLADRLPATLSGGQQQRMALARALCRKDPIILLDEPFSALDADVRDEAASLIRQLTTDDGLCVIVVSHDPDDARRLDAEILSLGER